MKYLISFSASVLCAAVLLSIFPIRGESEIYNDTLRLHVIADSDSEYDQEVKLKVRDAVLSCIGAEIDGAGSFAEAYEIIYAMKGKIEEAAILCLAENEYDKPVRVELGREKYPRREYENVTLPAGEYNSLRVIIGSGNGRNWWCVLFPSACTNFAKASSEEYIEAGFTMDEYRIITEESGKMKIRFRILEILSEVIGFEY